VGCRFRLLSVLTLAALTLCPLRAGAQTMPPFVVQSDNGDNRLQLGALVQFDGRFFAGDVAGLDNADTFVIRRLRPVVQGRVAKYFDFFFQLDFAGAAVNIRDAYFDTRFSDAFHVRVGKGKAPFGLERLQSVANLLFAERAMPTTVAPDRDMQIEVLGDLHGGALSYAAAIGNGVVDGGELLVTTTVSSGTFSTDISLAQGTHNVRAIQTDVAGNVSAASNALSIVVDPTAPAAPTALDLAAADDTVSSNGDNTTKNTSGLTISGAGENGAPAGSADGADSAPVSFFAPAGAPVVLGPDGQPLRKRRRRRRRGRGGRQREWRGAPPSPGGDGGNGGAPPSGGDPVG